MRLASHSSAASRTVGARTGSAAISRRSGTRIAARGNVRRFLPIIGDRRVDQLDYSDVAEMVGQLADNGTSRETIRKSRDALAMALDAAGITPNPARDKRVRLPKGDAKKVRPPTAAHVAAVLRVIARFYRLVVIVLDNTGMRVGELEGLRWGDLDEPRGRWLVRGELNHTGADRWVEPSPEVMAAVASLVPREDRHADMLVFPPSRPGQSLQAALRTELGRACKAAGVPHFSPHALRHRRISLWHRQGKEWALIGARVGQKDLATTANTYTHVLLDDAELHLAELLA